MRGERGSYPTVGLFPALFDALYLTLHAGRNVGAMLVARHFEGVHSRDAIVHVVAAATLLTPAQAIHKIRFIHKGASICTASKPLLSTFSMPVRDTQPPTYMSGNFT